MPSRIATCLIALALGMFAGVIFTASHQASVEMAGIPVPWGIIAAIGLTSALLTGLRLVFGTRIVPGFTAGGLLLAAGILALPSPGGSILVPDSIAGYVWSLSPAIIAAIVLGVPNPRPNLPLNPPLNPPPNPPPNLPANPPPRVSPSSAAKIVSTPASKGSDLP